MDSGSTTTIGSSIEGHLHVGSTSTTTMESTNFAHLHLLQQSVSFPFQDKEIDGHDVSEEVYKVDEQSLKVTSVKIVWNLSIFSDHPYDVGIIRYAPSELNTILVFEQYEKGLLNLDR
jgi:hypothetical protein